MPEPKHTPEHRTIILKMICDYWEQVGDETQLTDDESDDVDVGQILGDYCLDCGRLVNAWVEDEDEMEARFAEPPSPLADRLAELLGRLQSIVCDEDAEAIAAALADYEKSKEERHEDA